LSEGVVVSFPPIVSIHGEVLHNQFFDNLLEEGQLLLVDCGAENSKHYAGDMTRTFPVSENFTSQQKEIYAIVLEAQKSTAAALKPGVPYKDIHLMAANIITTGLKDLGIMHGNVEEAVEAGAHALFFPHGLGHMMGFDVHDMENLGEEYVGYNNNLQKSTQFGLSALRLGKELEPGYVLTIEPGIYFIPSLIDIWKKDRKFENFIDYNEVEKYRNFGGIRIEDDFVIISNGSKLLGSPVPKEIHEIEAIRQSALS
jgi:Xaa-Pro aminopeptidase